jgi:flagellar hook protein FlgE
VPTINTGLPIDSIQLPLGTTLARPTTNAILTGNLNAATDDPADTYDVTIGVYDSLGAPHSVTLTFSRPDPTTNDWEFTASGTNVSGSGAVSFDPDNGQYVSGGGSVTITGTNGAADTTFNLDLTGLTQLATDNDVSIGSQDGLAAGSFTGFFVTPETGQIYGLYSNGMQQMIGQLALANFVNPSGLTRLGQNLYQVGTNSGEPSIGTTNTGGRGSVASGYLEASNVDLAQEFTNMILAQRGFQASSRVITTSDEILQELVNIKR